MADHKRYLGLEEEAKRLGVSPRTLERRCKDEKFPFIRFGSRILFDPELSNAAMAARVHNGLHSNGSRAGVVENECV